MNVEMWPIDRVVPYDRNPRQIGDDAVDAVAQSIRQFGFRVPLVVDRDGVLIAGHTRLRAARKLGLTEVPVCVGFGISKPEHAVAVASAGADGVIIGSRIVKIIEDNLDDAGAMIAQISAFIGDVRGALECAGG